MNLLEPLISVGQPGIPIEPPPKPQMPMARDNLDLKQAGLRVQGLGLIRWRGFRVWRLMRRGFRVGWDAGFSRDRKSQILEKHMNKKIDNKIETGNP